MKASRLITRILLAFFLGIAVFLLFIVVYSFIGRIKPDALLPESSALRFRVENPLRFAENILSHESFDEIIALPEAEAALPAVEALKENPLLGNPVIRYLFKGKLEGVVLDAAPEGGGRFLAAWDLFFLPPLLRVLPLLSRFIKVPNLYYVKTLAYSYFEYRTGGKTFFIGARRNLLVISDNSAVFEPLLGGGGGGSAQAAKAPQKEEASSLLSGAYDAEFVFSSAFLVSLLPEGNNSPESFFQNIEFPGPIEAGLSVYPKKLELHLTAKAVSRNAALSRFLERGSRAADFTEGLPARTQYGTILSIGSIRELADAAAVFLTPELTAGLERAESSSRSLLGMGLDELLYSWTGEEFAVFGLEGRPHPVYAVEIKDEEKRKAVFERAFKSFVLNENVKLNLDGTRIPRIELPGFLEALLERWNLSIPSPYYLIYGKYLLISESAETLLASQRAMQKNELLIKTPLWRSLAGNDSASGALSLYYSLDRTVPFFLKGKSGLTSILGMYRQGLLGMNIENGIVHLSLSVIPGSGSGLVLMPGYPVNVGANPGNRVYGVKTGKADENRIILARDGAALSLDVRDNSIRELAVEGQFWAIPAGTEDGSVWIVTRKGRVTLADRDMKPLRGFPVLTGLELSCEPAAYNGKLYLCDEDRKVHVLDMKGGLFAWETDFAAALRSPPSFITLGNGQGDVSYAAVYPKSFLDEIWLFDESGRALPGWPAAISGIAFGSPLVFSHNDKLLAAFVTQAGELFVFDENAAALPPFPLHLSGIFYQQPVFDGECLWLVSSNGILYQINMNGEILSHSVPGLSVKEEGTITVFDSDGDKIPEVFITGEGNALYAYSGNFQLQEGFPLPVWGRPLFSDLDGNGKLEIAGVGMDTLLYRWQMR